MNTLQKSYLKDKLKNRNHSVNQTIDITVKRYYTSVDGVVIDKTDVSIPAILKTFFPVYLLGSYDLSGGYRNAQGALPVSAGISFLGYFIYGVSAVPPFLQFTGLNTIKNFLRTGDIVFVYTDNPDAPSAFVWVVLSTSEASQGAILSDIPCTSPATVLNIDLSVDNVNQFKYAIQMINSKRFGQYTSDPFDIQVYRTPDYKLNDFVRLKISFEWNQYFGLATNFDYNSDVMQFNLNIQA